MPRVPSAAPMGSPRRVTIGDLARELGLSQSSVSAALNDTAGVSEATRERVKALAGEWGWRPHAGARALRTRRVMTVGLVLARDPAQLANEPFYYFVLAGIEQVLQEHDYSLLLRMVGPGDADLDAYRRWSDEQAVDGVLVFDAQDHDPRVPLLQETGMPAVLVGDFRAPAGMLQLDADTDAEAALVVEHLAGLGHRRIAQVSGPLGLRHERARVKALRRHARAAGLDVVTVETSYSVEGGEEATRLVMDSPRGDAHGAPITAIVGASDLIALGAYHSAGALGLAVPHDLTVVSWDDSLAAQLVHPKMTSLDRDPLGLGRRAAEMLVAHLAGEPVPERCLAPRPRLVVRGSSGAPRITASS